MRALNAVAVLALLISSSSIAYNVFDPRPDAELRDLSTDQPGTTESPYSLDAGHLQFEWEAVTFTRDKTDGVKTDTLTSSLNLKIGLTDSIDAQLIVEPRTRVKTTTDSGSDTHIGSNDTEVRFKFNLWGNDGGDTAFAIMPFVRFPTHDSAFGENGKTEGGIILPLAFSLPGEWDASVMIELDAVRNEESDGYVSEFLQSISFSHALVGKLDGFFELVNSKRNESGAEREAYFDFGVLYPITKNLQLDAGVNLGLTAAADDKCVYAGISWRL
ncbi:MAG: hypothetical protein JWM78_126 [Verrucomicrobiaceae bacterium]|nr:hypothetical protein [Verrucomicrobiaceae bacterium]